MKPNNLTVADLMTTGVITVRQSASLAEAREEMRMADIRHLPVVDDHQHVVGILSDRDLLRGQGKRLSGRSSVAEVMTKDVSTVAPRTLAREAASLMILQKIGALPVLDDTLACVGIITETDFLQVAVQALGG